MAQNIKTNPFYFASKWNEDCLDSVIGAIPINPTTVDIGLAISDFVSSKMYNIGTIAEIDQIQIYDIYCTTINFLTANSWCNDCCDNTFDSFKLIMTKMESMGFNPLQLQYINQIIGMPCNDKITSITDFKFILSQLETSILVDNSMSVFEKNPILMLIAISQNALSYWIAQSGGGAWATYMIPPPSTDWIRPFWLSNTLGALISLRLVSTLTSNNVQNQTLIGLIGGVSSVSTYAIFK